MLIAWGAFVVLVGLATNEWTLRHLVYPDGKVWVFPPLWAVRTANLALVAWGVATILGRRRALVRKLNVPLVVLLVVAPLAAEGMLRLSFRFEGSPTRRAELYAHPFVHSDYWKLYNRWNVDWSTRKHSFHPRLGWTQTEVTAENPLGLYAGTLAPLSRGGRPKVLFYGDSFVAGVAPRVFQIPVYMDARMPGTDVVHLGVGGYGTDQILLMLESTVDLVERPFVILSAMLYDIDRAVLTVRTAQKPRFELDGDGELVLSDVPLSPDQQAFFASPTDFPSFLAQLALTRVRPDGPRGFDPLIEEKKALNAALLDRYRRRIDERGLETVFVIFYPSHTHHLVDWREAWLKQALDERGLEYFDTKPVLAVYCKERGVDPSSLYEDGHHGSEGNRVIGDALVEYLRGRGFE